MKKLSSNLISNLLKYGLGFGALAYVVAKFWNQLQNLFRQEPQWEYLLAAAALSVVCTAIQMYRWYILVHALGLPFSARGAVRLGLVGYYYNSFLPGSVGGDLVKAFFIAKDQPGRRAAAVATVMADRVIGLYGLILFVAVVGGWCWFTGNQQILANEYLQYIIRVCAGIVVVMTVGYIALGFLPTARADRFAGRLHKIPKLGHHLAEVWYAVWTYRQRPGAVLLALALSALTHPAFVFIFHFSVQVFPPENRDLLGTLPEHFVIAPIGYIAQAFFPAPGGVGGGEAIFGYLYTLIRGPEAAAVGVAGRLSMRLIEWTLGLIGYIAYLRMKAELPIKEAEAAGEQDDPYAERAATSEMIVPTGPAA
ncbi:lysylphosphatidylglycerol synthase transmembrane domain-containing protein [Fimbriiglobus ruber]|uniref:Dolichol-P-glucose synthetase n=1 Tax=Fimbriiglobus ruber TaxID=1908690 RepID=A0A225D5U5_9BACT|nr:lysylphosphatidylglycerol synthase transmembrane domain-containing protein [Fimbriiglobus ruber]OWK36960.1 hypothetical protein FRUB_07882 [Fimbriiglobus ruber]